MVTIEPIFTPGKDQGADEEEAIFQKIAEYIERCKKQMQEDKELENDLKNMTYSQWLEEIGADPERVEEEKQKEEVKQIKKFDKVEYARIWRNKNKSYMRDYNNNNKEQKRKLYLKSKGKQNE